MGNRMINYNFGIRYELFWVIIFSGFNVGITYELLLVFTQLCVNTHITHITINNNKIHSTTTNIQIRKTKTHNDTQMAPTQLSIRFTGAPASSQSSQQQMDSRQAVPSSRSSFYSFFLLPALNRATSIIIIYE